MSSRTTLKLPDELRARLAAQAESEGKTPHAYMLEALTEKANRADRRREFLAAGAASLRKYQRTGIAYEAEDVKRYILGLAAGRKPARPKALKPSRKTLRSTEELVAKARARAALSESEAIRVAQKETRATRRR